MNHILHKYVYILQILVKKTRRTVLLKFYYHDELGF